MTNQKHYTKDLTKITSVRLSANLLDQGLRCADSLDMTFSDFIRQSLVSSINSSGNEEPAIQSQQTITTRGAL
jgi:hypothetical protein